MTTEKKATAANNSNDAAKTNFKTKNGNVSNAELLRNLEAAEKVEKIDMESLNSGMLELKEGDIINCAFVGFEKMVDKEGEEYTACKLLFKDGSTKINADKVLVSSMERWQAKNPDAEAVVIRIICKGIKKGDKGNYKELEIYSF